MLAGAVSNAGCYSLAFTQRASSGERPRLPIRAVQVRVLGGCRLQYRKRLLVMAQALIDKDSIDFIEMSSYFGRLKQFLPSAGCSRIIVQHALHAGTISRVAERGEPAVSRISQLGQLLRLMHFFICQRYQRGYIRLLQGFLLTLQEIDEVLRRIVFRGYADSRIECIFHLITPAWR